MRERATCLFLDLNRAAWYLPGDEGMEAAISLCASLLCDGRLAGRPLALGAWAGVRAHDAAGQPADLAPRPLWSSPRTGEEGRRALLRLLAAIRVGEAPSFAEVLQTIGPRLPWGAQALWIVPRDTPELRCRAAAWQTRGHPVVLLCVERREGASLQRAGGGVLRVWEVRRDGEFTLR